MKSKRDHEGYLLIDHTHAAPMPDEWMVSVGLPAGSGRGKFECATFTCNHCKAVVVLNPQRTRERAWCKGCDHYICDSCGVTLQQTKTCRTFEQIIAEVQAGIFTP